MNPYWSVIKTLTPILLLTAALLIGYFYGHHEGALAGQATLAEYQRTEAQAIAHAENAAQEAQAQADAAIIMQQQRALDDAQTAAAQRAVIVSAQDAKLQSLQAQLHAIPSTDKAAATWLGALPSSIQKALNAPGGR